MMRIRFANIICLIALSSNNRKPELLIRYRKATTKPDRTARPANSEPQSQTALPEQQSHNRKPESRILNRKTRKISTENVSFTTAKPECETSSTARAAHQSQNRIARPHCQHH